MRILQVHNRYRQPGGEDRVVEAEAALLSRFGHEVRSHVLQNRTGLAAAQDLSLSIWNPRSAKQLAQEVEDFEPNIIHAHNTWFRMSASVLRQTRPLVMTLHNFRLTCANGLLLRDEQPCRLCLDGSSVNAIIHGCYRNRLISVPAAMNVGIHRMRETWQNHVDLFIALTEFGRSVMVNAGLPPDRVLVKPNFVEDPGEPQSRSAESETVAFVGRIEPAKGVHLLAELWNTKRMPFRLIVVGDGPDRQKFNGVSGVTVTGWMPEQEVGRILAEARALVVPSLAYETQSRVVLEAFARGTPVVGSDHGGIGETIRPLGSSLLVRPGSVDSLAEAIGSLEDDLRVRATSRTARQLYETKYSPTVAIRALESAYERTIEISARRK